MTELSDLWIETLEHTLDVLLLHLMRLGVYDFSDEQKEKIGKLMDHFSDKMDALESKEVLK